MARLLQYVFAFALAMSIFMASWAVCGEEDSLNEIFELEGAVPVIEGEEAPFNGILMPIVLAVELGFNLETLEARLLIDVQRERELCNSQLQFEEQHRELEKENSDFQIEQLTRRLQEQAEQLELLLQPAPWYQRWGFAYGMGILSSIILIAGGVAAMIGVM